MIKQGPDVEVLTLVQEHRILRQRAMEPALQRFRGSLVEIAIREAECAAESELVSEAQVLRPDVVDTLRWAESIARGGRESVRFQRWLEESGERDYTYAPLPELLLHFQVE